MRSSSLYIADECTDISNPPGCNDCFGTLFVLGFRSMQYKLSANNPNKTTATAAYTNSGVRLSFRRVALSTGAVEQIQMLHHIHNTTRLFGDMVYIMTV